MDVTLKESHVLNEKAENSELRLNPNCSATLPSLGDFPFVI